MEFINTKNSDVSDLFKDFNLPQIPSKSTRKEIEDYYVEVKIQNMYFNICCLFLFNIEIQRIYIK
jgi:hypothetical protein